MALWPALVSNKLAFGRMLGEMELSPSNLQLRARKPTPSHLQLLTLLLQKVGPSPIAISSTTRPYSSRFEMGVGGITGDNWHGGRLILLTVGPHTMALTTLGWAIRPQMIRSSIMGIINVVGNGVTNVGDTDNACCQQWRRQQLGNGQCTSPTIGPHMMRVVNY